MKNVDFIGMELPNAFGTLEKETYWRVYVLLQLHKYRTHNNIAEKNVDDHDNEVLCSSTPHNLRI